MKNAIKIIILENVCIMHKRAGWGKGIKNREQAENKIVDLTPNLPIISLKINSVSTS